MTPEERYKAYLRKIAELAEKNPASADMAFVLSSALNELAIILPDPIACMKLSPEILAWQDSLYRELSSPPKIEDRLVVLADGAARGNNDPSQPNQSAWAFIIKEASSGKVLFKKSIYIGDTFIFRNQEFKATNNLMEYAAVKAALEELYLKYADRCITVYSDSKLLVDQMTNKAVCKAPALQAVRKDLLNVMTLFRDVTFEYHPREEMQEVDTLVNECLDNHLGG